jgi:hypothetical protein
LHPWDYNGVAKKKCRVPPGEVTGLFREVSPGETSPVTWGFEEAKNIRSKVKVFPPLRLPLVSDIPANQPIKKRSPC